MRKTTFIKSLFTFFLIANSVPLLYSQGTLSSPIFSEDFGTLADATVLSTSNTNFSYVRVGTSTTTNTIVNQVIAKNPGSFTGSSTLIGAKGTSISTIDKTGLTSFSSGVFTLKFTTPSSLTSAILLSAVGTGSSFGSASGFTGAQLSSAFQVNGTNLQVRANGAWTTVQSVATSTSYTVAIVFNNTANSVNYSDKTLASNKFHLWVNGSYAGEFAAATASLAASAFRVYCTTSQFEVDDVAVYNTLPAVNLPAAVEPVFSISSGSYGSTQNVSITTTTPAATIYYTVDGSTPTTSSSVYAAPVAVSSTTTIKAIAVASGYTNSSVGSATYTFPTAVANLGALNAATHPGFYKVTGEAVLTLKSSTRNAKYFQDNSGAVLIDDNTGVITSSMSAGDGVTGLIGTTAYNDGMLQFTPFDNSAIVTSSGKSITPQVVSLAILSSYPAQLVKVEGVTIAGTGNFASSTSYDLNSSSTAVLRTQYADLDYVASAMAIPTVLQDITGVVLVSTTTVQIVPRSSADFANSVATKLNGLNESNIIAFAQNGSVSVKASEGQNVQIFNSMGQQILNKQAIEGLNVYAINKQGVFVVKVGDKVAKVQL